MKCIALRLLLLPLGIALLTGCDASFWDGSWLTGAKQPTTRPAGTMARAPSATGPRRSPALEGTIGSLTYLQGARLMRVHGYGLVIGLGDRGSRNCRPSVRDQVLTELRRYRSANPHATANMPPPEKQLDSLDSAVVEVIAEIPAGAAKDQRVDLFVRADDPDTKSLAGGFLVPCELKIYQEVTPEQSLEGRVHARASGPIFVNPFAQAVDPATRPAGSATRPAGVSVNPREGYIIGGGVNVLDRRLSVVTNIESYSTVRQVAEAINRRFTSETKIADGVNPSTVELKIPPEWREDRQHFLDLVMHLPLAASPALREARGKALVAELGRPDAPLADAALALEGLGPAAIPLVQPLYADPRRQVNYYAAQAGLRLGDELALQVLIRHANDAKSPFRLAAIREMGDCKMPAKAGAALRELLGGFDPRIRICAYESLRKVDHGCIRACMVGENPQNFVLEVVPCDGPGLIYARRTDVRRLALIGGDRLAFRPPLLYAESGQPVVLSANADDAMITILRKEISGRTIGPVKAPLSVPTLVRFLGSDLTVDDERRLQGLGLDYGIVLDVLYGLCEKHAINADLRWEEPTVEDLVGPLQPIGRPESEL